MEEYHSAVQELVMEEYHPIIRELVENFKIPESAFTPHAQQLMDPYLGAMELKEQVLKHKITTDEIFQQALANFYELEYCESFDEETLDDLSPFTREIPIRYAKKHLFFPLKKEDDTLEVVVEDPTDFQPIDDVGRKFNCRVVPVVASRQVIMDLINKAYDRQSGTSEAVDNLDTSESFDSILGIEEPEDLLDSTDEEPIKRLVNSILWQATKEEASDVHLDPTPQDTNVRYRIDGVLHSVLDVPKQAHIPVVNRIKVMSRLDIAQKGIPQDGRTMVLIAGKKIDIRVSTLPTVHGEKIVMRLLYQSAGQLGLKELGLSEKIVTTYEKIIHKTGGIILVTGPTGSGKTTTLYASLGELDHTEKNIITVEDPVEYKIKGYSQVEINHKLGLTFAIALRSILRQDPDVVMVGEMRDTETAQIAIQAALTGHLVFSTVHTNNAPATITRLIDMGVEPFLVASTIIGVLAQRLVRRICEDCKEAYVPHEEQLREIGITDEQLDAAGGKLFQGKGCNACRDTGYRGRLGIHELLLINENIKTVIMETNDANVIKRHALNNDMVSLRMDGAEKVLKGYTTVEEIVAITSED